MKVKIVKADDVVNRRWLRGRGDRRVSIDVTVAVNRRGVSFIVVLTDGLLPRGWWRIVGLVNMWVLDEVEKGELSSVGDNGDEEDFVACCHERDAIVPGISNRVHWMWGHLKDAIKGEFLVDEVEEISPVPGVVFDNSMGIELDPEVEDDQKNAADPASDCHEQLLAVGGTTTSNGEAAIRGKVGHENEIYHTTKE